MSNITLNIKTNGTSFELTGKASKVYHNLCTVEMTIDSEYFCAHRKTFSEAAEVIENEIASYYFERNREQEENDYGDLCNAYPEHTGLSDDN